MTVVELDLGRILLIVNPAAQNGNGAIIGIKTIDLLDRALGTDSAPGACDENVASGLTGASALCIERTQGPGQATEIAASAADFDTVVALGGDGIVHEVVNGLMRIDRESRPRLGIIPVGSGNDYARTLGISTNYKKAVDQLLHPKEYVMDVGLCNDIYFAETVSFGLDAAIAIETMERRKRTGKKGVMLYLESGLDQLKNHFNLYDFEIDIPVLGPKADQMYLLAIQNGPTYGGGFSIAPEADPTDGLLDICIAHPPLSWLKATMIFLLAKNGHHRGFKQMQSFKTPRLKLRFETEVPGQIDGEELFGKDFDIRILPGELKVLTSTHKSFREQPFTYRC